MVDIKKNVSIEEDARESAAGERIKEWEDRAWAEIRGHICSGNDAEQQTKSEEK